MLGFVFIFLAAVFNETGISIGKHEIQIQKESIYSLGFLTMLWSTAFFFSYALIAPKDFIFSAASLPTLLVRIVFEIILAYYTVRAVASADRSTYGFLRAWTIPLLLGADVALGYAISIPEILGIAVIFLGFFVLFSNHGIRGKGSSYVMATAVLAAITLSFYKYDITHFNSVAAEQGIVGLADMVFYFLMARFSAKENPLALLGNPVIFIQSLASGVSQAFLSFAYIFAPASVITAASRVFGLFASVMSGNLYFKERHLAVKLGAFVLMAAGIVLLAF